MKKKRFTKWFIGAFALTMAVLQPAAALPDSSPLNTMVTAEAASTRPGKVALRGITAVSNNRIRINWNKTSNATHYRIYYKVPGGRWKLIKTVGANTTSYTHVSSAKYPIKCGQKYTYTVRAYNSRSKKSGSYNAKGLTTRTVPSTVSLRSARRNANSSVTVSWNKAYGGNYYRVYRKTPGSGWKLLANVRSTSLSYTDRNPVKGQKNIYTVRMYNSSTRAAGRYSTSGVSVNFGGTASTKTPGRPTLYKISSSAYNKITISWKKASNATHYRIYYKTPGSSWKLIQTVGANTTSYTHTSSSKYPLAQGQKYIYTVRAYNSTYKTLGSYDSNGLAITIPKQQHQHSYKATVTIEPTCTTDGVKTYACTVCGVTYTEKIPATGEHRWKYDGTDIAMGWQDENGIHASNEEKVTWVTCCGVCGYFYGNIAANEDLFFTRYWQHTDEPGPCHGVGYTSVPVYARYELYECPDCHTYTRGKLAYYHYHWYGSFEHTLTQEEIDELGLPHPEL